MRMTRKTIVTAFCAILLSACGGANGVAPQIARPYQSTSISRLSGSAKLETLYNFTYKDDGSNPIGGLAADFVGNLYVGTIAGGGAYDSGTVDELLALGSAYNEKTLVRFDGKNGADFVGDPIVDRNGTVFGNTDGGRYGAGAAISITRDARERVIWSFGATKTDGVFPLAGMVRDRHRALYGTTELGGPFGGGTVYRLSPSGRKYTETILHAFGGGADGKYLSRALTLAPDGSIYGTTSGGGNGCHNGCGIVFKLTPQGTRYTESILWNFHGGGDGSGPSSGLTFDAAGSMYGVTDFGGGNGCADGYGCGVVYKLTPSSSGYTERVLWVFGKKPDGYYPLSNVVIGPNGQLYGTAWQGGTKYGGTFWELVPSGSIYTEQVLWNFTGGVDGGDPEGDLITDSQHRIYGTTYVGGTSEVGTVYRFTP